jgi:O-methyltransferase involved in polyketide biosynthesis
MQYSTRCGNTNTMFNGVPQRAKMRAGITTNAVRKQMDRMVFQINSPTTAYISVTDVADALQACQTMSERNRRDYMYGLGIDYDRVMKYYMMVLKLNNALEA